MIDYIERKIFQSLYDHYPEWELTPSIIKLGHKIAAHQQKFHLDLHLLTVKKPTIVDCIKASYAYARHEIMWRHELVVTANADYLYINCYICKYQDALAFCRAVCFLRFLVSLAKRSWHECSELFLGKTEVINSNYDTMRILLEVYYHDQISECMTYDLVDSLQLVPTEEPEVFEPRYDVM